MANEKSEESPKLAGLQYLVSSVLGTGDKGTVVLVTEKRVGGGRFALRIVKREEEADDTAIEKARAEHLASEKVNHPAILKVLDFRLRKSFFRVVRAEQLMEYVKGKTLDEFDLPLPVGPSVLIFHQAAAALAHMHRRGVIHGTLEPSRVLLSLKGQVKVRRYGLSQLERRYRDQLKLNACYAPPDQLKEKILDSRTDIYSLGATMYHILTGQPPIGGAPTMKGEGKKISTPATLNPKIPVAVNNLLVNCLQSNPNRRPEDMYEVVKQLEAMVNEMRLKESALVRLMTKEE